MFKYAQLNIDIYYLIILMDLIILGQVTMVQVPPVKEKVCQQFKVKELDLILLEIKFLVLVLLKIGLMEYYVIINFY